MNPLRRLGNYLLLCGLGCLWCGIPAPSQPTASVAAHSAGPLRDGQHDFDFDLGTWKLHVSRLDKPLTGSSKWNELDGTVVVRKIWDGLANIAEVNADGPSGHLQFLALRLYNPDSHQWSNSFANSSDGTLSVPMVGEFKDGRGEFIDQEPFHGRAILVRFVMWPMSPDSVRSEQAFSDDGGKTWEVNWVNTYTRVSDGSASSPSQSVAPPRASAETGGVRRDGQHDFDFNFGIWKTHISRLQHPLTGSTTWMQLDGTVVVRKIWGGRAQLEEVEAEGTGGARFKDLALFLYNPQAHQWSIHFANSKDGRWETPTVGEFKEGRGEFYDQEPLLGRDILVRILWSGITPDAHHFEESFSDDAGKTWEPVFVAQVTRKE
ncbi:MAG: hypothetical protein ACJ71S_12390 [Acidobacteriaceae bacterium]